MQNWSPLAPPTALGTGSPLSTNNDLSTIENTVIDDKEYGHRARKSTIEKVVKVVGAAALRIALLYALYTLGEMVVEGYVVFLWNFAILLPLLEELLNLFDSVVTLGATI